MDNLTHSLAGMLLAEGAVQARPRFSDPSRSFRIAAYVASIFVNNAPDLDFVYSGITERPFGYLIHHRGHTHTVPACVAFAALTAALVLAFARRSRLGWTPFERPAIVVLCAIGPFVHVAMDFSNNYGVHPFWPLYDGWFYGDAVFIIEPTFWAIGLPPLAMAAHSRTGRGVLATLALSGVAIVGWAAFATGPAPLVPPAMALAITALTIVFALVGWRASPRASIASAIVACWCAAAVFFGASSAIARQLREALPGAVIHDIAITPMPANPLCASALVVETDGDLYRVERALVALAPSLLRADRCPAAILGSPTAPLVPTRRSSTASIAWSGEFSAPLRELSDLARDNCQAEAVLRFARVPYWTSDGPNAWIVGDLRFDRNPGLDFTDVRIHAHPQTCPQALAPWLPPRRALLTIQP